MTPRSDKSNIYTELKELILSSERENLLPALKDTFRNAAIEDRGDYKRELLKLAQEPGIELFEGAIFETLASLTAIYQEHIPRKNLLQRFDQLYEAGEYKEAGRVCSDLIAQGLDYIGAMDIGEGTILPLHDKKNPGILQFNQDSIKFRDLDLNLLYEVPIPQNLKIIDALTPLENLPKDAGDIDTRTWILAEDKNSSNRLIFPLTKDRKKIDRQSQIEVPPEFTEYNRLSRFQNHLLLVGEQSIIYYKPDQGWERWLSTGDKITCFRQIEDSFWIGIVDGNVRILKKLEYPGVRKPFKRFSSTAKSIAHCGRFAATASEKEILVSTTEGASTIEPIFNDCPIQQIQILNNEVIAVLQNNGRLVGRDIHNGSICWQINLKVWYDSLLCFGVRVYCQNKVGKAKLYVLPGIQKIISALKKHNISITEAAPEKNPSAPVHDLIDFFGRDQILDEIKKNPKTIFLITGAPKSGKTSLLFSLNDVLNINTKCCYVDFEQVNIEFSKYEDFERMFYGRCLTQHGLQQEQKNRSVFQKLSDIVKNIRGSKSYCAFCLDNFSEPEFEDSSSTNRFTQFFKELCVHSEVRLILTSSKNKQQKNGPYLKNICSNIKTDKNTYMVDLSPFNEEEAKTAIRKLGDLDERQLNEIFKNTGGFPHLIQLYKKWFSEKVEIENYSDKTADNFKDKIFAYFKDFSPEAHILFATLIYQNLISKKINITKLYEELPLLSELIETGKFEGILNEIDNYSNEFKVGYYENSFQLDILANPRLFFLASRHIPWIKVLFSIFQFSANANVKNAHEIILAIRSLYQIQIEDEEQTGDPAFEELKEKYKDHFYIRKMSKEARDALKIPLKTYVLISIQSWKKGNTIQNFSSLYASLEANIKKQRQTGSEEIFAKFYVVLFSFSGSSFADIDGEMSGLERVSIIDTGKVKEVLLAEKPLDKTRYIIFKQLNISERSPYIYTGPVEDLFYGRDIERSLVRGLPENIGVFGTRTIGKTSLMLKLYRDLKQLSGWQVFDIDCSNVDSERKLLAKLADKMEIPFKKISRISKFRKYITQKAAKYPVIYLFLLDEVGGLISYDAKHRGKIFKAFNMLRTELLKYEKTAARFVLFGFAEMFNEMNNLNSRLYNFMVFLPLQALKHESALALVTKPIENIFVKWQNIDDARYLVDQCSGHPWLLQAACNTLLKILDEKKNVDTVKRENVQEALFHDDFITLCLRPYESLSRIDRKPFPEGIHKISTLAALLFQREKKTELFSLNDLREELKSYGEDISPDHMHRIIDNLCMYGILRFMGAPDILVRGDKVREKKLREGIAKEIPEAKVKEIKIARHESFEVQQENEPEFKYQFAVKIFPRILAAKLGGLESCKVEIRKTVKKIRT